MSTGDLRRPGVFVAVCLGTFYYVLLSQHLLPSGEARGVRSGAFADFFRALPQVGAARGGEDGEDGRPAWGANRLLKQHMDTLETRLEEGSHVRNLLLPPVQWLLLAASGVGNESVYSGREDWLILRQGFDYLAGPPFLAPEVLERRRRESPAWLPVPEPDPRPALFDFAAQLADRGIRLLVLPAPTKVMIHPETLARRKPAAAAEDLSEGLNNPSFAELRGRFEAAGVEVFDAAATLRHAHSETGVEQFLRTDSHWSPPAVEAVARKLAERIRQLDLPLTGRTTTWRRQKRKVEGVGDLERALQLPGWQRLYVPQQIEVNRVVSRAGRPWRPDPRAEILLLGDSFTNVYSQPDVGWGRSAGLAEQLSYTLERPVDRLAVNAGGATASRRRLAQEMASGKDRLAGKKLVVWEFAIRELAVGEWQLVDLPAL